MPAVSALRAKRTRLSMLTAFASLAPLVLGACATDPADTTVASNDPKVVCTYEAPTGSNLKTRRCWTEEQTAQQQQGARAVGDAAQRTPGRANPR